MPVSVLGNALGYGSGDVLDRALWINEYTLLRDLGGGLIFNASVTNSADPATLSHVAGSESAPQGYFDWSGVGVHQTGAGNANERGFTLISPTYAIGANHYPPSGTLKWVNRSNRVITRTIASTTQIGSTDIYLIELSSAIDPGTDELVVYPVPTEATLDKVVSQTLWHVDRNRKVFLRRVSYVGQRGFDSGIQDVAHRATVTAESPVTSDSGQPAFVAHEGQLVLLGSVEGAYQSWYVNPAISKYITEINAVLAGAGESLTTITLPDLSEEVSPIAGGSAFSPTMRSIHRRF